MSYILDALKKSEQQRGNGTIPDVQTVHSSSLNYRNEKKSYWPYFLIVAILLNLIAIIYFILDKDSTSKTIVSDIEPTATTLEVAYKETQDTTPMSTLNKNNTNSTTKISDEINHAPPTFKRNPAAPNITTTEPKTISSPTKVAKNDIQKTIVDYHDLPESLLRQMPTITVSAHVYSSNPLQRSIVINDKFLEEGDYVLDDLTLFEITTDGAIFDFNDTRFHYAIISGWQ